MNELFEIFKGRTEQLLVVQLVAYPGEDRDQVSNYFAMACKR